MQKAEVVLAVLRERGRKGLPLTQLYRQMFNKDLYLLAYGNIYSNQGAMTPGASEETADGMSEEKISALPAWQTSTCFDAKERAVLAYADRLVTHGGRVPDTLFETIRTFLTDEEILELTYVTCLYDMHAVMTKALRLEWDDRDDPIVEVAAPKDFSGQDFLDIGRR